MKHQMDVNTTLPELNTHIDIFQISLSPEKRTIKEKTSNVYAFYFGSIKGSNLPSYYNEWYMDVIDHPDLTNLILNYKKRSIDSNSGSNLGNKRKKLSGEGGYTNT